MVFKKKKCRCFIHYVTPTGLKGYVSIDILLSLKSVWEVRWLNFNWLTLASFWSRTTWFTGYFGFQKTS